MISFVIVGEIVNQSDWLLTSSVLHCLSVLNKQSVQSPKIGTGKIDTMMKSMNEPITTQ